MASRRGHRRHTFEEIDSEIERRRAADNEADREYTTAERLAALRGEPEPVSPGGEGAGLREAWARAPPSGVSPPRRAEPTPAVDFDAEVEERIRVEIEDFERGGGCAPRGGVPAVPPPAAVGSARTAEWIPTRHPAEGAVARPAARGRERQPAGRVDYRAAAPGAFAAMSRLEAYVRHCGLQRPLLELVALRASQLNRCPECIDVHRRRARRAGEPERRLDALAGWRATRLFTPRERAALAWTEAVSRAGPGRVRDRIFRMAREQLSEAELVNLTVAVIAIAGWSRLAIAFRAERGQRL